MQNPWIATILSTLIISLLSLLGTLVYLLRQDTLNRWLVLFVGFSLGAMLGNASLHLIPEAFHHIEAKWEVILLVAIGFALFFVVERIVHRTQTSTNGAVTSLKRHPKSFGYLSLYADAMHNFTDGILIGAAWLFSPEVGLATTLSIALHEIPQEIGDFGILLKAGFVKRKAILFNLIVATTSIFGAVFILFVGKQFEMLATYILPIAGGGFIYVSLVGLLPEVLRERDKRQLIGSLFAILFGFAFMLLIFALGGVHEH